MDPEIEKQFEAHVEKQVVEKVSKAFKQKSPAARRVAYAFSIFFNLLFLWIANNLLNWQVQWITQEWKDILDILNISLIANLIGYGVFFVYDQKYFYYIVRLALDALGIVVMIRMYQIFPFAFEQLWNWDWLNQVAPWLIILGVVGVGIGFIVRTVKLCTGKNIYD